MRILYVTKKSGIVGAWLPVPCHKFWETIFGANRNLHEQNWVGEIVVGSKIYRESGMGSYHCCGVRCLQSKKIRKTYLVLLKSGVR